MATDWAADVKKYDAEADDTAIAGIVRHCGIALRNRDSALVSFSDKAETDRVRTNFLKKKLGLTQADSVLDAAIAKVGERMKADRTKNRVTAYYLLASEFKALGQFVKAAPAAKKAPAATAAPEKAVPAKTAITKVAAKPAPSKSTTAAKAAGVAAVAASAAAAKTKPIKAAPAKNAPAAKTAAAPAKKAPAPLEKAAPTKKVAAPAKASTAKAAAPAANATQGLLDKAATTASDAAKAVPKAAVAAAAGTVAAAGAVATGAASLAKDTAANAADAASTMMSDGSKSAAADDGSEMNWLWWVIGIAVLAFLAWWWVTSRNPDIEETNATEAAASANASDVGTDLAAAVPEGNAAIPAGAGVTSEMRDGKPVVKVYFDTGMTAVTPDFAKTAGGLKSWLVNHSGAALAVSGYSDPSGDATANAELAKQRAQAVQSALVAADIPATSAKLEKPAEVTDATVAKEAARRVEVMVK